MAPAPNPVPSATTLVAGLAAIGFWRLSAVAAPHMAALAIMLLAINVDDRTGLLGGMAEVATHVFTR